MSADRKEIDLIIRAAVQGGKTLDSVIKSIADIEKAIESQGKAAKRGESSIDDLKATLLSLKLVQDQLKDQAGLIGQFDRLSKQIATTAEKTDASAKAYADYKEKLDSAGKATEGQSNKLIKLANASERNQTTLAKQKTDHAELALVLEKAGISTGNLAEASDRARQGAAQLGIAINQTHQSIATYTNDLAAAKLAEKAISDEAVFQRKLDDAAKLNKAGEYVRFWTTALDTSDAAERQLQINTALRKTADEAVAAARGYKTLGTASATLAASSGGLKDVINGIVNPAENARKSLSGVESELKQLGDSITAINGPIKDYREQVRQLAVAQSAIGKQAGLVDSFRDQVSALRQARTAFTNARSDVLNYAEALRTSGGANSQLEASLKTSQAALARARSDLQAQVKTTREMRQSMRDAGIATNDLAGAQSRLTTAARSSTEAMATLKTAHDNYGDAVDRASRKQSLFTNSGRTTLSLLQRIRGEVLSLVSAYVGIYGAANGATKAIDAFNAKQAIRSQLALSVGNDDEKIGAEYRYIQGQAERIGISFEVAAKGYAKFSAAAKLAGRDTQEIRYIFEAFSEVGRVAHLTTDELDGVFKALTQMISKGTIQAEELRGQLGDRLFGAFQVAALALKDQFPDLDKAMKNGLITSDQLVKIAEKYRQMVGERLPDAIDQLDASQARLNTALFDFKVAIAEQGFAAEYSKLVKSLSEFFASNEGTQFAKDIASALGGVVKTLRWVIENLDTVKIGMQLAFGLYAGRLLLGVSSGVTTVVRDLKTLNTELQTSTWAGKKFLAGFLLIEAFFVGWQIGTLVSEKFKTVKVAGIALVVGLQKLWTQLKYDTEVLFTASMPDLMADGLAKMLNKMTAFARAMLNIDAAVLRAMGSEGLAVALEKSASAIELRTDRVATSTKALTAQLKLDLVEIERIGDDMFNDALNPNRAAKPVKPSVGATDKPDGSTSTGTVAVDEKAVAARLKLKEQLENELQAIDAKIDRQEKQSLSARLSAIDETYGKLVRKIAKLGGEESKSMMARLNSDIATLKLQETKKFNDALLAEQTSLQSKLEAVDAKANRGDKSDIDKRLEAIKLSYEHTYREIAELRSKLLADNRDTSVADEMKTRLDAGIITIQNLDRQKYYEEAVNAVLDERKAKLDLIEVQQKTGLITSSQARDLSAAALTETQPKLEAIVASGLDYVDAMLLAAEATGANTQALDTLKAKLLEARNSVDSLRTGFISAAEVNTMLSTGATQAFTTMSEAIGGVIKGTQTWGDAIKSTADAFRKFAADFLMQIAQMILKRALFNALETSGGKGGFGGMIAGAINTFVQHDGGIAGASTPRRLANPDWFANAPKYHGGGIAGLSPDEYPAILKRNEEVLTQADPRNVLNGGKSSGGASAQAQNLKIINMIDSGSVVSEGLSTQAGEKAFFNFIRANRTGLKQVLA